MTNRDIMQKLSTEEMAKVLSKLFYEVSRYTNATHYIEKWLNAETEGCLTITDMKSQ